MKIIIIKKNKTTLKNKCKIKFITGFVILEKNFKSHLLDFGDIPIYAHSLQKLKRSLYLRFITFRIIHHLTSEDRR